MARPTNLDSASVVDWMRAYTKPAAVIVGVGLVGALALWYWRNEQALQGARAETAYYQAQSAMAQENRPLAQTELQKVVDKFPGTTGAVQASLLLAQLRYDEGKHAEGVAVLERVLGDAPDHLVPGVHAMIAAGYEDQRKPTEAAAAYQKAVAATPYPAEKEKYLADAARALMAGGKTEEARKIWQAIEADPLSPTAGEARVRLGELEAKPAGPG